MLQGKAKLEDCIKQNGPGESWLLLASAMTQNLPARPAELLNSTAMSELMARLASEFDTIIINAPPLLSVVDPRILAQFADDVLIVATVRKTPKEHVRRAIKALGQNSGKVLGIIINGVDRSDRHRPADYTKEAPTQRRMAA